MRDEVNDLPDINLSKVIADVKLVIPKPFEGVLPVSEQSLSSELTPPSKYSYTADSFHVYFEMRKYRAKKSPFYLSRAIYNISEWVRLNPIIQLIMFDFGTAEYDCITIVYSRGSDLQNQ